MEGNVEQSVMYRVITRNGDGYRIMSIFYFFIQSIPESMGIIALCFALARVPLRWGQFFIGGLLLAVISYIIRSLPVTFGLHLPVMIFVLFVLIIRFTKLTPSKTIVVVFTSFFSLALLEYLVSGTFFAYTHMDPEKALANEKLWSALGVAQAMILNIIALIVAHFLKPTEEGSCKQ
jgi:hypothetical protein